MNDVDVEQRLRRTYRAVAVRTVVTLDRERLMDTDGVERQLVVRPSGHRRATVVSIAAALVVLVGAVAAALAGGDTASDVATAPGVGRWEQLPAPPVDGWGGGTVWTGTEVIEFGGFADQPLTSAAAYDPARRTWRQLADLPEQLRGASIGVWTGDAVVAFASQTPGVAGVYDPGADEWRLVTDPALPSLYIESYAFWTGDKVLLVGFHPSGETESSDTLGAGAGLYDPATDQWQPLPDAPQPLSPSSDAVWTGQELIVIGQALGPDGMTAMALDLAASTWRTLPVPPLSTRMVPVVTWTGSELVVVGGSEPPTTRDPDGVGVRDGAVYDPTTGTWAPYPAPPVAVSGNDIAANPTVAAVGHQVVALHTGDPDHRPLVLDTETRTWQLGAPPPDTLDAQSSRSAVSTGRELVVWALDEHTGTQVSTAFSYSPP